MFMKIFVIRTTMHKAPIVHRVKIQEIVNIMITTPKIIKLEKRSWERIC